MSDHTELMQRFRAAATNFLPVVDSAPHLETDTFLAKVSHSMAKLYSLALSLPALEPQTSGSNDSPFQKDRSDELRHSLKQKIGPLDSYWAIFDSTAQQEPVKVSGLNLSGNPVYQALGYDFR